MYQSGLVLAEKRIMSFLILRYLEITRLHKSRSSRYELEFNLGNFV